MSFLLSLVFLIAQSFAETTVHSCTAVDSQGKQFESGNLSNEGDAYRIACSTCSDQSPSKTCFIMCNWRYESETEWHTSSFDIECAPFR